MKIFKTILAGSGLSSFVYYKNNLSVSKILTGSQNKILKSKNFYEMDAIGGNTCIWGGYINFKRHKIFLANNKYKNFFLNNSISLKKIFKKKSVFYNTFNIVDKAGKIFRVKEKYFNDKIENKKIDKIFITNKFVKIKYNNKIITVKNLILCIGNLNLIILLYNSNLIKYNDIITYDDSECGYVFNLFINPKTNYYIPMPIKYVIEKLLFKKSVKYKSTDNIFLLQKFSNSSKKHKITCGELINLKHKKLRFFLSNHVVNLRINNIPIQKYIFLKTKNIKVFCSGTLKKYIAGPISQDLIHQIVNK